ncbi:uncharacterized protein LOC131163522 [Malania oleifera]|uniref:uncharacterized protein LOC131163522 n=1 Tax=Malania oleifera TaxID=397392 RepID=UPI0025AE1028|nr:uncharacterized protein LOC131163522 [Malania oleifera]
MAKRIWSVMRVVYCMARKGISKRKLMLEFNLIMKRSKIAGKAIGNLMFHHHHEASTSACRSHDGAATPPDHYEFSCSNSPAGPSQHFPFYLAKRGRRSHGHHNSHFFSCAHAPPTADDDFVKAVLEMLNGGAGGSAEASPLMQLPGLGQNPAVVRQLRITDSPFPLRDADGDSRVDQAAEEFIRKFYNELKQQKIMELN